MMEDRILVVDDEATNLKLLREILKEQYTLGFAKNGVDALRLAQETSPNLILLDIMMPGMDGYEVCRRLKADLNTEEIPIIIVSALSKEFDEVEGFRLGAVDYITKPLIPAIVQERIKTHLTLQRIQKELQNQNEILEQRVEERTLDLTRTQAEIVDRLAVAAEYRDPETGDHIHRMSHYAAAIGQAYGLNKQQCRLLLQASPMHDIGKIGIPDAILLKPDKLNEEEWKIMKTHTEIGGQILANGDSNLMRHAQEIALTHHEKWNGMGYPNGLQGEEIPLWGRISAIGDVFDALTSKRPYKEPWPVERAFQVITEDSGQHFDPQLVELFLSIKPEILRIKERFPI